MNARQLRLIADAQHYLPRIMTAHPELAANGWDHCRQDRATFASERAKMNDRNFPAQVAAAYDFITATYLEDHGSYTLKHEAERWAGDNGYPGYISNGAFIAAAIAQGYECMRDKRYPLNCTFKRFGKRDLMARRRSR